MCATYSHIETRASSWSEMDNFVVERKARQTYLFPDTTTSLKPDRRPQATVSS